MVFTDTLQWSALGRKHFMQIFTTTKSRVVKAYKIDKVADAHEAYAKFIMEVGAPIRMVSDGHQAENKSLKVKALLQLHQIPWGYTEAERQNQNCVERYIGWLSPMVN